MVATVSPIKSAGRALRYYYEKDPLLKENSKWYGKTAERLGLAGQPINKDVFKHLLAGKIPAHLLDQEQQHAHSTTYAVHHQQPHPGRLPAGSGDSLRQLSECNLATVEGKEAAGVLQIDVRTAGQETDSLRWAGADADRDSEQVKAEKLEEFIKIHRGGGKQRPGVDLTFSAPKSLSILFAQGDERVLRLHQEAVAETMAKLEELAGCRMTQNGQTIDLVTGNYLIAGFDHSTARPVTLAQLDELGGGFVEQAERLRAQGRTSMTAVDIHGHQVVMNITWCEESQSYKAIDNAPIFSDQKLAGAMYHSSLAAKARDTGYPLRDFGDNGTFEFAAVPDELVRLLSPRSAIIEHELAKLGLTRETASAEQLEAINKLTRNDKVDFQGDFRLELSEQIATAERSAGITIASAMNQDYLEELGGPMNAREGIESGLRHAMERSALVDEKAVELWAVAVSRGFYTIDDVHNTLAEMKASGELLAGEMERSGSPGQAKALDAWNEAAATPGMLKYAAGIAKGKGLTLPASGKFTEIRNFLDEHAPQAIGLRDAKGGELISTRPGATILTTVAAQERERAMVASVISGQGTKDAIMTPAGARVVLDDRNAKMKRDVFDKSMAAGKTHDEAQAAADKVGLNPGQQEAAELILTSTDRVNVILGVAGAGKSFTLGQAKDVIETLAKDKGIIIHGVAPSHQAKNELKDVTGSGDTLQAFLTNPKEWRKFGPNHLLIVDEAGMASTKQMSELERISAAQGFRYFLVGDLRQTTAVEAGKPLEQIAAVSRKADMNDSVRHKTEHLAQSAKLAAEGRMAESLDRLGSVQEIKGNSERRRYIANRFIHFGNLAADVARAQGKTAAEIQQAAEHARKETLLLTTTNAARKEINQYVRESLGLAGKGQEINTLSQKDTTAESRKFLRTYKAGDVLQFAAEYKNIGVKSGDRLTVAEIKSDRFTLIDSTGQKRDFQPARFNSEKWGVYTRDRIELTAGDRVRLRENQKEFQNGDWGKVLSNDGKILLIQSERDPKRIWTIDVEKRALCVDHGYAMTAHGSQGATKDRTLVDYDVNSRTLTIETAYVMQTRSRYEVEIVTNDLKRLPDAISKKAYQPNALDLEKITTPAKQKETGVEYGIG